MKTVAALVLVLCGAAAHAAPVVIPDTPAGHTLQAWLDAFNSGDRARLEAYHKKYEPEGSTERSLGLRRETGGFEFLAVDKSARLHIEFRVKEKTGPTMAVGKIDVKAGDPAVVANFGLRAVPPGMTGADTDIKVDAGLRTSILDGIAAKLTEYYVYPDTAKKMVETLRAHQKKGEYDAISDGDAFARLLTDQLVGVSHDHHLRVECVPMVLPPDEGPANQERPVDAQMRARLERDNCGFEKVERREGNVGYLKFNFFARPEVCGATATAAMTFLGNVDALIVDLRDNGGGDPKMVAWVSSYLFAGRTHLNDLYERRENKTTEYWTENVPGKRLAGKPVYVLTSKRTFSGAEEFSYNLKSLKRATIVGETTGGGAHPTGPHRLADHFFIGVPFARAVNPITKTDWEGKGVEPDVKVAADKALETAEKLVAEKLRR